MQIYLPIAEMSVNIFLILGMGVAVGFISGMFGIGGGFLMTPFLIFTGLPPAVAVATEVNQIMATSASGAFAYWRRRSIDFKMGLVLLVGGIIGSVAGVALFSWLKSKGQVDLFISLSYVLFLGVIGSLMFVESLRTIRRTRQGLPVGRRKPGSHTWIHGLPFKMRFRRSKLYISAIPPLAIGAVVGVLAAIMGIGGGFIMVPAMIYLLRMPTNVVVGTSLFQVVFVTGLVTVLHAVNTQTVDAILALMLIVGGVVGAQFGVQVAEKMKSEHLRALLAIIVLGVCFKLILSLVLEPETLFTLSAGGGH
ncbi:MAG: sulfite exporter TauE/SafE family protein [Alphaproteobacteria bacterium]|nr:MAG: sulfite exporter TauE/SafE family protein [Alphaproteobacteria bacterium]